MGHESLAPCTTAAHRQSVIETRPGDYRHHAIVAIATALANERATLLTLRLQQHRKEHGALPSTLFELNDEQAGYYVRTDPFTGESLFYSRDGISKPLNLTRGERDPDKQRWAPSTQPVLCSAGPYGMTLELSSHRFRDETSSPGFLQLPEHAVVCILPSPEQDETILNLPMQPASAEVK